jgi:DNA-binding Lrp family transcriptional regulator
MSDFEVDAVDRGILYLLQENARSKITAIADAVNVSDNEAGRLPESRS